MKKSQQKIAVYLYLAIAATFTILNSAEAQILNPVKWSYAAKSGTGGVATIYLRATIDDGWHIYSVNQKPGGPQKTVFSFSKSPDYSPIGKPVEPKPLSKFEDAFGIQVYYFSSSVTFQQKMKINKGQTIVKGKLTYMACTDKQCLPPEDLTFEIPIN